MKIIAVKTLMMLEKYMKEEQERIFIIEIQDKCITEYVKESFKVGWSMTMIYSLKNKLMEEEKIGLRNKTIAPINNRNINKRIKRIREKRVYIWDMEIKSDKQ